jgi:hypothetical protein
MPRLDVGRRLRGQSVRGVLRRPAQQRDGLAVGDDGEAGDAVVLGTSLLPHVPVTGLRHALGIILAAASLGVLTKAGVALSPTALVGIPAALAVVSVIVHRRRVGGRP